MDLFGWLQVLVTLIIALLGVIVTFWPPKKSRMKASLVLVFFVFWLAAIWFQQQDREQLVAWQRGDPTKPPYVMSVGDSHWIMVHNESDLPAFEIAVRIHDPAKYVNLSSTHEFIEAMKADLNFEVTSMPPNSIKQVGTVRMPPTEDVQDFRVQIIARSGSFRESLKLRRVKGTWKSAYRITDFGGGPSLIERSDPDFPRGADGKIEW